MPLESNGGRERRESEREGGKNLLGPGGVGMLTPGVSRQPEELHAWVSGVAASANIDNGNNINNRTWKLISCTVIPRQ